MTEMLATLLFYLTVQLLGLAAWPLAYRIFKTFPDKGWAFSKIIGILLTTWLAWFCSSLHWVSFTRGHSILWAAFVGLLCWGSLAIRGFGPLRALAGETGKFFFGPGRNWFVLTGEILFLGMLLFWTNLRSIKPELTDLEKFMDYGFMLSALKTSYFPPMDHFLGPEPINYYYVGQVIAALLSQLSGVPAGMAYNLQMSNIFGLGLMESFSAGAALFWFFSREPQHVLPGRSLLAGLASATFVMLVGNLQCAFYLPFQGSSYWYPAATRFIPFTIHEYPIYSFVVNDLHGHVSDIPIVLLCIALLMLYCRDLTQKIMSKFLFAAIAFTIGTFYAVSSWDFAIYLVLFGFTTWFAFAQTVKALIQPAVLVKTALASILMVGLSILPWLPHWFQMKPPAQSIQIVKLGMHSPLWQLAIVWGLQGFFVIFYLFYRRWESQLPKIVPKGKKKVPVSTASAISGDAPSEQRLPGTIGILIFVAGLLILLPELIYVKDIYPGHPRSNTMFKFYYQAWIMLGLVCGFSLILLWNSLKRVKPSWNRWYKHLSWILIAAGLLYAYKAIDQSIGFDRPTKGIDGTAFLDMQLPADAAAIRWMNQNVLGQPLIVEAVGESYTFYARVATFTGFPTVLGWPNHEWLWRGTVSQPIQPVTSVQKRSGVPDTVDQRRADVQKLYQTENPEEAEAIISKYGIQYIYLGQLERDKYPALKDAKFPAITESLVYDRQGVRIFKTKWRNGAR